jgi:hypothetical protein
MSDTKALPNPESPDPATEAHTEPETTNATRPRRSLLPWLGLVGFVVLAAAIFLAWRYPSPQAVATQQALSQRMASLDERLMQLEQKPAPTTDLGPLTTRVDALERRAPPSLATVQSRLDALEKRQAPDLSPIEQRLAAVEQRPVPDLGPLDQKIGTLEQKLATLEPRIAALEQRPAVDPGVTSRLDAIATRQDTLAARAATDSESLSRRIEGLAEGLGKRIDATADALGKRIEADTGRLDKLDAASGRVSAVADKAARLSRLQAADAALAAGQPVGDVPGAPQALSRYAKAKPPTEAELRLSFPAAERAARAASRPQTEGKPFMDRVWSRAQELVTVRQGDQVIVGDTASTVLARARTALDAGDLAGAVAALDALDPAARQAMSDWLDQAHALLDARAALADMAARV